jgi:predicted HicB family RNase H-like nuclease
MTKPMLNFKRMTLDMHNDLHKRLKIEAALRNISMNLLVHKAIYYYLYEKKEDIKSVKLP